MKLSIVIVNYNVVHFLEQCLQSVYAALDNIEAEVFVVDNNSIDKSVEMVQEKFPQVRLIANKENLGFSKANNQAIRLSCGEYVLLLNPDTVVESDTFSKAIAFMDSHPEGGGLGVRMVDGRGVFLPESKRSLPIPSVAFYKIFGLSKVFKKSKRFGRYHLTYLDENEVNEVEVLSGAFMLLRKTTLDKIGLLDEDYFMYGEDIDLSYRITQGGYKNYYFPETRIIHYKGESTKKSSLNYVLVFYRAMQIFAKKHFSQKNAFIFNLIINVAIWLRASLSIIKRILQRLIFPFLDFLFIYVGIFFIALYWQNTVLATHDSSFPDIYFYLVLPLYTLIWSLSIYFSKGYKIPIAISNINKGITIGTIILLLIYSLLSEDIRFSRAVILLGTAWTFFCVNILRYIISFMNFKQYPVGENNRQRIIIVGDETETKRVATLLNYTYHKTEFIGFVYPQEQEPDKNFIGNINQLKDIVHIYRVREIIFCGKNFDVKTIINLMEDMNGLEYKIAPDESSFIIGSNSVNLASGFYTMDINSIGKKENRRKKRFGDIVIAIVLLLTLPINIWAVHRKKMYIRNIFLCLIGKKTWVTYCPLLKEDDPHLPPLKKGVLYPSDNINLQTYDKNLLVQINSFYAKDYRLTNDIRTIIHAFSNLGR